MNASVEGHALVGLTVDRANDRRIMTAICEKIDRQSEGRTKGLQNRPEIVVRDASRPERAHHG